MKECLTGILYILTFASYGQDYSHPLIRSEANSIKEFSPKGWFVLDSIYGDLNEDKHEDAVFILQKDDSLSVTNKDGDVEKILPRILAIAFKATSGKYVKAETNEQILIDNNFPPAYDPSFNLIEIDSNNLILKFGFDYLNGNFYFYTYAFRSQMNQFVLVAAQTEYVNRINMDYEKGNYNFLTKKCSWTIGVHSTEKNSLIDEKVEWSKLYLKQMKTLKSMGRPGTWEVAKGKWL